MLHVIGYGGSDSWNENVDGQNWTGTNLSALVNPNSILETDGFHVADGTLSNGVYDDQERLTVGNPSPDLGERTQLTELDIAFLQDIGHTTIFDGTAIPEPDTAVLALLALQAFARRKR